MGKQEPTAPSAPGTAGRAAGSAPGLRAWWNAAVAAIGTVVGLAPHVLHHIGLLAGTALIAGGGGTALFGVLGLAASVPFLLRLRRRFHSWWAPAIGLAASRSCSRYRPSLSAQPSTAAAVAARHPRRQVAPSTSTPNTTANRRPGAQRPPSRRFCGCGVDGVPDG